MYITAYAEVHLAYAESVSRSGFTNMLMKTCNNIAKRQKHLIVCKLYDDTIQRNLHLFIFHAMQTTLGIKHYLRLLLIEKYHYVGVYRNNKWLTISLHSLTSLQRCYRNRRVQHTAK